jgi:Dolichyl-phosphate-mannose-protein mannosyltransferase
VVTAQRISLVRTDVMAYVAVGVNLAITLPLAYVLNIWQDEAYTLQTTSRGLGYAFHQAIGFEQNAPLYFLLLTLWRHVSGSVFSLRLFSVVCIAIAIALVPALVRRYVPKADAGLVTLAAACNPFAVWAAVEMRVYAMIVLVSALLMLACFDAFLADRPSRRAAVLYAICMAVALYTQYYLAFLIAAQAVTILIYRRAAFLRFAIAAGAAALAFAPMLAIVPAQVENFKGAFAKPSLVHSVAGLSGILARYVLPLPFAHAKLIYAGLGIAAVLALVPARRLITPGNAPILVMTGCCFAFFAAGTYAAGVHVLDRHAASLYLPATLSIFAAFTFLRPPSARRAAIGWLCLTLALSFVSLAQTYRALAKPGDWIRATAYLRAREQPHEPIVVFEAENALPLAYYYSGPNRIFAIPTAVNFRSYDVSAFVIRSQAELQAAIPRAARIWLITAGECSSANIVFGCDDLEQFVAKHYRVESDATFYGSRIRLLRSVGSTTS